MTSFLLDTDCSIYAMLGSHPALRARLAECEIDEVAISAISFAEIMLEQAMGHPPNRKAIKNFIRAVPILPFDDRAAHAYAQMPFKRARFDRLLAAHALSIGATVITNNEAGFADVPGLKIENWTL
ncbi:type II toxin-antitoxin system VapC family toxin [Leptolyngbya sp. 15MV]|nr:type II toxin-antitoxin system VapC family toxin [Leptolyngbya sp. 15MV]